MSDVDEVRTLVTDWVDAVARCDLEGVLQHHGEDIVMFDVPPPYVGVRGIAEYRDSWQPFFEYLRQGAVFELTELEVVVGADVAFAFALLRCGTPAEFAVNPDNRLRITVGLRKVATVWTVVHEHHSFPTT